MSSDDDSFNEAPTPPRPPSGRRRRHMSDDDRAESHREWRRLRSEPSAIPEVAEREITRPEDLFGREPNERVRRSVEMTARRFDEPAAHGHLVAVADQLYEFRSERRKRDTEQELRAKVLEERADQLDHTAQVIADQVVALRAAVSPEHLEKLDARLQSAEKTIKTAWRLVIAGLITAAGSLGGLGGLLWHRAAQEGGDAVRLEHLEGGLKDQQRALERAIDQLRLELGRRSSLTPVSSAGSALVSRKDQAP